MKRILVVGARGIPVVASNPVVVSGMDKHAERLFPLIASRGWQICVADGKPYLPTRHYRATPSPGFRTIDRWLYAIATLIKAWRMRPDIAHFASPESAVLLWAYKLAGCRIVVRYGADCHASMSTGPQRWAKRWVQFQLRWADSIIAVTPALAKKLRTSAKGGSIHVIGNALDRTDNFPCVRSAPVSGDYILFVGPIKKSIHRLISAFRVFARSHPNMQLVIVGQWSRRADRRKIAALDDERIVMLGNIPRPQLVPLYRGARFFVNPSTREGHTESLLEAISFGCPILLSDLPENRDLRLNAKYYFDPGNLRSIISAFNRAHAHPDGFRVAVDRFPHWEDIADQMIQVYEQLFADEPAVRTGQRAPSRI